MSPTYLNDLRLKDGKALILRGPQGSGKNIVARDIARHYGTFIEIETIHLDSPSAMRSLLADEPRTLIVEGALPKTRAGRDLLKALITQRRVVANAPRLPPKEVATPNIIFCTGSDSPLKIEEQDRRFWIVDLKA